MQRTDADDKDVIQKFNILGYLEKRIQDAEWGALHMAAAAACQGIALNGGDGPHSNKVFVKNPNMVCNKTCQNKGLKCNAHVSISGKLGKATKYDEQIGTFYNYGCNTNGHQLKEVDAGKDLPGSSASMWNYYHYCCCKH